MRLPPLACLSRRQALALLGLLPGSSLLCGKAGAEAKTVRSFEEIRRKRVVIQEWDLSCGAAALATLLNYQHGDPISEREIAEGLIRRAEYLENPELVRIRQGFSLLDLKRFAESRGYAGTGYADVTIDDLDELGPAIVPIRLTTYDHFVVFRGRLGDRILLADPAYGNRIMHVATFEKAWQDNVVFVVERRDETTPPDRLSARPEDFRMPSAVAVRTAILD